MDDIVLSRFPYRIYTYLHHDRWIYISSFLPFWQRNNLLRPFDGINDSMPSLFTRLCFPVSCVPITLKVHYRPFAQVHMDNCILWTQLTPFNQWNHPSFVETLRLCLILSFFCMLTSNLFLRNWVLLKETSQNGFSTSHRGMK